MAMEEQKGQKTKALIGLPLPPQLFHTVSSIYHHNIPHPPPSQHGHAENSRDEDLFADLQDALSNQRPNCVPPSKLNKAREQSLIQHLLTQLQELPSSRGDDLQTKCLLELYGLQLAQLQRKVWSDVSSEYWLNVKCAYPDRQLFDCGMMRLHRPLYGIGDPSYQEKKNGIGDPFAMDADNQLRKNRDAERLSRLEEQAKNHRDLKKIFCRNTECCP